MIENKFNSKNKVKANMEQWNNNYYYSDEYDDLLMKHWPVPDSYSDKLPAKGTPGSFWERRGDCYHTGIDIFAPDQSPVVAIEGGVVIDKGVFRSPEGMGYWNMTYFIVIKTTSNIIYKYAEFSEIYVHIGDFVNSGSLLGKIGITFNKERISGRTPMYVKELVNMDTLSMLHLELYHSPVSMVKPYLAGNFYGQERPYSIINPYEYLYNLKKD